MEKMKEWYTGNSGEQRMNEVLTAFGKWYRYNLDIEKGEGRTIEDIFGLPYTSTSDFAAIWNCQAIAKYRWDEAYSFSYIAISTDHKIIVGLENATEEIEEIFIGRVSE